MARSEKQLYILVKAHIWIKGKNVQKILCKFINMATFYSQIIKNCKFRETKYFDGGKSQCKNTEKNFLSVKTLRKTRPVKNSNSNAFAILKYTMKVTAKMFITKTDPTPNKEVTKDQKSNPLIPSSGA